MNIWFEMRTTINLLYSKLLFLSPFSLVSFPQPFLLILSFPELLHPNLRQHMGCMLSLGVSCSVELWTLVNSCSQSSTLKEDLHMWCNLHCEPYIRHACSSCSHLELSPFDILDTCICDLKKVLAKCNVSIQCFQPCSTSLINFTWLPFTTCIKQLFNNFS